MPNIDRVTWNKMRKQAEEQAEALRIAKEWNDAQVAALEARAEAAEQRSMKLVELAENASAWFKQVTSSDGTGHADLGREIDRRLAEIMARTEAGDS